jgi:rubredoxin---NAD+ reductase
MNRPFREWICRVCGWVYDEAKGDPDSGLAPGTRYEDIPEDWACPICGVAKGDLEPHVPAPAIARAATPAAVGARDAGVVIVGAGRAGWQVAQALRERSATLPITMVSACNGDVYDKPLLSVAVARGLAADRLVREHAAAAAARLGVRLLAGTHAVGIDAPRRRLRTTRGTLRYTQLVLAHGAQPALPPVLPADAVWRVNDLAAYQRLRAALGDTPRHVAIVGAGLVGCELANDLALAGHRITLLDVQPRPLAALLPAEASAALLEAWHALPIAFIGGAAVARATAHTLTLADGRVLEADAIVAATGLRAPPRLAASAGLAFDTAAGGIVVDGPSGATSVPGIFACGDCVVVNGHASRYIEPIARQAQGIAAAVCGGETPAAATLPPVLRVKTSSLPITVSGPLGGEAGDATWHTEPAGDAVLRMVRRDAQGRALAHLVAR